MSSFSGYSYYWNREKDLVSWLHPLDEDAVITLPAAKLAEAVAQKRRAVKTVEVLFLIPFFQS